MINDKILEPADSATDTILFQSLPDGPRATWLEGCLESVRALAASRGWTYTLLGDELFDPLPLEFAEKVRGRGPILSDLGRLLAARSYLERYQRVIWLDADVLIFAPERFEVPHGTFGFGRELWVQPHSKQSAKERGEHRERGGRGGRGKRVKWRAHRSVCNALCYFERDNPFLDFYIYTCQSVIARADAQYIAPQMIGPKLLSALHSIADLPLTECIGSASPDLIVDLIAGEGPALERYREERGLTLREAGLNLCQSLIGAPTYRGSSLTTDDLEAVSALLLKRGSL